MAELGGTLVHLLGGHILAPVLAAWLVFRSRWRMAALVMTATILVDLDHLLANPVYDPDRCSIGFHPLHSWPAIIAYGILAFVPVLRLPAIGLLIHMIVDGLDCVV